MKQFAGKTAFVTGAGSGMGQAIAVRLGTYGASVICTDINKESAETTATTINNAGGSARGVKLDVTDRKAFEKLLQETTRENKSLDYIFNNAGIAILGEVRDQSDADWQRVIDVDLMGVVHGTRAAYDIMLKQGSGHIVNTASIAGLMPAPLLTPYSMCKHAVVGLSTSLRQEALGLGVKVSVVCPGIVRTGIADGQFSRGADFPDPFAFLKQKMRIQFVTSDEAAGYILDGVRRNKEKIVFPAHGKSLVRTSRYTGSFAEKLTQFMLRDYRKKYRVE